MGQSQSFNLLNKNVQRWVWKQQWDSFRDIQEKAIDPILKAEQDVIISAATAGGKTEAAFLPACSKIAEETPGGVGILYISPLKALINDQYRRLRSLCESIKIPATPWHGDVSQSIKNKRKKDPAGVLLITPESLESLLLNQSGWCLNAFSSLCYIIIDEFHSFIGSERGCQLQSLMHRMEFILQKTIPRIALSATLGDMDQVADYLRPNSEKECVRIISTASHSDLKLQLRGYLIPEVNDLDKSGTFEQINNDLYRFLRAQSNLIFANSRQRTELIAARLSDKCKKEMVPNEFFPHHGSLSKNIRESLEARLQKETLPTTAVCTMTLELGIDIGTVDSIAQVTPPHSVASLRQRLGRSGRRGNPAVLRFFIPEKEITDKSSISDRLRLQTFQCIAMVNLLLKKWYEPALKEQYNFSTLVQQTLSVIGQYGGVRADQLWRLLCETGPFSKVDQELFVDFLKSLGAKELISQMADGQLILGVKGERLVEHFTFYTAFQTPEEYHLESDGRFLGTLPIDSPLFEGQIIIFAGKRWKVISIDKEKKRISLKKSAGGDPPLFGGEGQMIHDQIRKEMKQIYLEKTCPTYLDEQAESLFQEGIESFYTTRLDRKLTFQEGKNLHIFTWLGDPVTKTIVFFLHLKGLKANSFNGVIEIENCSVESFNKTVRTIISGKEPSAFELTEKIENTTIEKHDWALPKRLTDLDYGAKRFDIKGAWEWLTNYIESYV